MINDIKTNKTIYQVNDNSTKTEIIKNQVFECPICFEIIESPKYLPCFHKFCIKCIQWLEQKQINGKIKCPLCRKEHIIMQNSVSPTNQIQKTVNILLFFIVEKIIFYY